MLVEELYPLGKLIISASGIASHDCEGIRVEEAGKDLYIVGDFQKIFLNTKHILIRWQ